MSVEPQAVPDGDRKVYSVSSFNQGVSGFLKRLPAVWVEGEIAELRHNPSWGLVYLSLKDPHDGAMLPATMTRQRFAEVEPAPAAGQRVHALGRAELWPRRGEFRFSVLQIEPVGLGRLLQRIEELRRQLALEGLFDPRRKRPLPFLPRTIGLVCGKDAAAKRDVVETATTRYPPARFRIEETVVQGAGAPGRIVAAIRRLDADPEVDVIVIARGGGSVEDLLPFSEESVCRAVAGCATPVVSAIGHEQDSPLVDLAADVRAGTPSLAAKLVVPDHAGELASLDALLGRGSRALELGAQSARRMLLLLAARPAFADPTTWIANRRAEIDRARDRLAGVAERRLERETARVDGARDRLRLLGPAATLERGYAIAVDSHGAVLRAAAATSADEEIGVRLARGSLTATVTEVRP